ncbi:hypothetical protein G9P44_000984 [Scheffersomyces stipitis]|nr:hypothetical protein G9P44_000984 [Scheffersomyces stipitis]
MKTCYDNLNQSRIVVSLESLFDGIDDDTEFFTRQYSENSTRNSKLKAMITEIRHGGNAHTYKLDESLISKNDARVLIDRTKTLKFSKKEILEISKTQIFDSIVSINGGKFYSRKTGIFQGLPLSGTFCDIVYDDMIQEQFQFLLCCEDSLIARLADDFLVITTRFNNYQKVLDVINGESLNEYGAVVNSEKTSIINDRNTTDSFRFVGLVIEIGTLEISREFTKNPFPSLSSQKSFKTAFEYLSSCYKQRLCDFMLDLELDTLKTILHNINNLLGSLMSTFRSEYKHLVKKDSSFSELEFEAFLIQLLQITLEKFFEINGEHVGFDDIIIDFKSTLQLEFQSIPQFMDVLKRIHSIDI